MERKEKALVSKDARLGTNKALKNLEREFKNRINDLEFALKKQDSKISAILDILHNMKTESIDDNK